MAKLFFIGDSITKGSWDSFGGWSNRLTCDIIKMTIDAEFLENTFYCLPYNLGVSGNTSKDLLLRVENEVKARVKEGEKVHIVYAIGVNDAIYMNNESKTKVTEKDFKENLEKLIAISRKIAQRISFIGLLPVDDEILNPTPWSPDQSYKNKYIKEFENVISNTCKQHNLPFLPLFETWISRPNYKDLFIDGLHPNDKGHELLSKQIAHFLITDDFKSFCS